MNQYELFLKRSLITKLIEVEALVLELQQISKDNYIHERAKIEDWISEVRENLNDPR